MLPRPLRQRMLLALIVSAVLVLSGPYIGLLRAEIKSAFPGRFGLVVNTAIALAIATAAAAALARIRERRALRYGALVAAGVFGAAYAHLLIRGSADTVVVERFHFVEYGLIAFLFYRAWRPRGDTSALVLPVLAALIVGTLDEGLQWFVPDRIGEWRDLELNAAASVCGLLFGIGVDPPDSLALSWRRGSPTRIGLAAALTAFVLAAFVSTVHLGYAVHDAEIGSFLSRYSATELLRLSAERAASGIRPLNNAPRLSREDQYLAEAIWHVQERNARWTDDLAASWFENAILERYFAPALDLGHRWPSEQRAAAAAHTRIRAGSYASRANRLEIYTWNRRSFWMVAGACMVLVGAGGLIVDKHLAARAGRRRQALE